MMPCTLFDFSVSMLGWSFLPQQSELVFIFLRIKVSLICLFLHLYQVGKFYELYNMDATVGVKELGLIYMKVYT